VGDGKKGRRGGGAALSASLQWSGLRSTFQVRASLRNGGLLLVREFLLAVGLRALIQRHLTLAWGTRLPTGRLVSFGIRLLAGLRRCQRRRAPPPLSQAPAFRLIGSERYWSAGGFNLHPSSF